MSVTRLTNSQKNLLQDLALLEDLDLIAGPGTSMVGEGTTMLEKCDAHPRSLGVVESS